MFFPPSFGLGGTHGTTTHSRAPGGPTCSSSISKTVDKFSGEFVGSNGKSSGSSGTGFFGGLFRHGGYVVLVCDCSGLKCDGLS
jgi:hypothetical protein